MNEIDDDYQNITNGINSDLENLRHPKLLKAKNDLSKMQSKI